VASSLTRKLSGVKELRKARFNTSNSQHGTGHLERRERQAIYSMVDRLQIHDLRKTARGNLGWGFPLG